MRDSRLHHQLSPQSIRFCPLCGGALEPRAVPPEGKREMAIVQHAGQIGKAPRARVSAPDDKLKAP